MMADIYRGVVQADGLKARQALHKLTGSVGLLGGSSVIEAAEALHQLAVSGQVERMHDAYKVLEHEIRRLEASLGSVVKEQCTMKILVADDDAVYRSLLERMLTQWDYQVVIACDGQEALEVFMAPTLPGW